VCTAVVLLWARPITAQQQARAPAVPFELELSIIERRCAADCHSATTSILICPMLGVQLRSEDRRPARAD